METKHSYWIDIQGMNYETNAGVFHRLRAWALENKKDFQLQTVAFFDKESYTEEAMDTNGGYEKESSVMHTIEFVDSIMDEFWQSISFFNWERK